jgi:hypothetical protein
MDHGHEGGMLTGIWDAVKGTTLTAAHMAEMAAIIAGEAAHNAKEAASGLLETGMEKAHEAGEKIEELVSAFHIADSHAPHYNGPVKPVLEKETVPPVMDQVKEKLSEVKPIVEQLVEKTVDEVNNVVEKAKEEMSKPNEEIMQDAKDTASATVDQAAKMVQDALPVIKDTAVVAVEKGKEVYNSVMQSLSAPAPLARSRSQGTVRGLQHQQMPRSMSTSWRSSRNVEPTWNQQNLVLTMDVVSHLQRIADRTGDAVLHETARRAHSACAKGLSEAPGVHLTWVTPQQANDLVNLAICTQDHELADFARYCQSVAATSHIAVEPTPGKIQQEILKGYKELQQQGRLHTGPGYGAAFASVNRNYSAVEAESPAASPSSPADAMNNNAPLGKDEQQTQRPRAAPNMTMQQRPPVSSVPEVKPDLVLTMDVVSHIQRIADRTGNPVLHDTARKAHSAFAKGLSEAPGVHLTWITPQLASELMNLASRTSDKELVDFARYCQSVAATTQIGVEPAPGKILQEIMKGRMELQKQQQQVSQPPTIGMAAQ